jgi:hypothetical protein
VPWFLALGVCGVGVPQATIFIGNHLAGAAYAGIFSKHFPIYCAVVKSMWTSVSIGNPLAFAASAGSFCGAPDTRTYLMSAFKLRTTVTSR